MGREEQVQVNCGSFGAGSTSHQLNAYLSESHKLEMNHVAYKGEAPMSTDYK